MMFTLYRRAHICTHLPLFRNFRNVWVFSQPYSSFLNRHLVVYSWPAETTLTTRNTRLKHTHTHAHANIYTEFLPSTVKRQAMRDVQLPGRRYWQGGSGVWQHMQDDEKFHKRNTELRLAVAISWHLLLFRRKALSVTIFSQRKLTTQTAKFSLRD